MKSSCIESYGATYQQDVIATGDHTNRRSRYVKSTKCGADFITCDVENWTKERVNGRVPGTKQAQRKSENHKLSQPTNLRVSRQAHLLEQGPWIERKLHECIICRHKKTASTVASSSTHEMGCFRSISQSNRGDGSEQAGCLCLFHRAPVLVIHIDNCSIMLKT